MTLIWTFAGSRLWDWQQPMPFQSM